MRYRRIDRRRYRTGATEIPCRTEPERRKETGHPARTAGLERRIKKSQGS